MAHPNLQLLSHPDPDLLHIFDVSKNRSLNHGEVHQVMSVLDSLPKLEVRPPPYVQALYALDGEREHFSDGMFWDNGSPFVLRGVTHPPVQRLHYKSVVHGGLRVFNRFVYMSDQAYGPNKFLLHYLAHPPSVGGRSSSLSPGLKVKLYDEDFFGSQQCKMDSGSSSTSGHNLIYNLGGGIALNKGYACLSKRPSDKPLRLPLQDVYGVFKPGTVLADCAVLIIDSTTGAFEVGTSKDGQTRELGVKQMDAEIKEVSSYLKKVGYIPDEIPYVPISGGFEGDMIERSTNLDWYKGPTLLEALDLMNEPKRLETSVIKPLYKIGWLETSVIKPGLTTEVKSESVAIKDGASRVDRNKDQIHITQPPKIDPEKPYVIGTAANRTDAKTVPELFQMALSKKACIVFFDELDAVGGATNRPDTLDPALLRPVKDGAANQVIVTNHPGQIGYGYAPVLVGEAMVQMARSKKDFIDAIIGKESSEMNKRSFKYTWEA